MIKSRRLGKTCSVNPFYLRKQYPSLEGIKTILTLEIKGKPAKREDFADFDLCQGIGPKRLHRGAVQKTMIG